MNTLDDVAAMKQLDPSGVLASTALFPDQCLQAWKESTAIAFPEAYAHVKNIVVCGMGGSRFTPRTIKELYWDAITLPYEIVDGYTLPGYVNQDSLVILSSFSGTTEEVIACQEEAIRRGAKVTGVVKGGKIAQALTGAQIPFYQFDPKYNPCGQPRIGGGYLLMGHLGILKSLGFVSADEGDILQAIEFARETGKQYMAEVGTSENPTKQLALLLKDKHPFLIAAEFLRGFVNGFANQINETAKMISDFRYIPELNHHLMEGLKRPETLHQNGLFVFLTSPLYAVSIQKRFRITKEVVEKQHVATHEIALTGRTKLAQVLEGYTLSGFATFYMAMLYDTDPVAIPWVDHFKEQLARS